MKRLKFVSLGDMAFKIFLLVLLSCVIFVHSQDSSVNIGPGHRNEVLVYDRIVEEPAKANSIVAATVKLQDPAMIVTRVIVTPVDRLEPGDVYVWGGPGTDNVNIIILSKRSRRIRYIVKIYAVYIRTTTPIDTTTNPTTINNPTPTSGATPTTIIYTDPSDIFTSASSISPTLEITSEPTLYSGPTALFTSPTPEITSAPTIYSGPTALFTSPTPEITLATIYSLPTKSPSSSSISPTRIARSLPTNLATV